MPMKTSYSHCLIRVIGMDFECPMCGTLVKDGTEHACQKADYPYIYFWNRMERKGQFCRVITRGKMNSCEVEFEDGFRAITSRNALRKRKP